MSDEADSRSRTTLVLRGEGGECFSCHFGVLSEFSEIVSSPHHETTRSRGELLVQEVKQAETGPDVDVEAAMTLGEVTRTLVVDLTTAQAGLRLILQMQI